VASVETLKAEIAAIDRLDRDYWLKVAPERFEKLEYFARQQRRQSIMAKLTGLLQGTGKSE
jgi:hypothetical protein